MTMSKGLHILLIEDEVSIAKTLHNTWSTKGMYLILRYVATKGSI